MGIAENWDIGAFALFHRIGVKQTIATTALPPVPVYLRFLGISLPVDVPGKMHIISRIYNLLLNLPSTFMIAF